MTTDSVLQVLVFVGTASLGLVLLLSRLRHPWEAAVERYDPPRTADPRVAIAAMLELRRHLLERDYDGAHHCMQAQTNWFYLHRFLLPQEISDLWFRLRAKLDRLTIMGRWHEDWARQEGEVLHQSMVTMLELCPLLAEETLEDGVLNGEPPQGTRVISAPRDRSFSSIRS